MNRNSQENAPPRQQRRRRLILFSLPFAVIVLACAIKLISLSFFTSLFMKSYEQEEYSDAYGKNGSLRVANVVESYIVHFNDGNALYGKEKYSDAEKSYAESLKSVPSKKECPVRFNLVLSIEKQADKKLKAAQEQQPPDVKAAENAAAGYERAAKILETGDCKDQEAHKDKFASKKEELQKKAEQAESAQNGEDGSDGEESKDGSESESPSEDSLEELEKRQKEAEKKAQEGRRTDGREGSDRSGEPVPEKWW